MIAVTRKSNTKPLLEGVRTTYMQLDVLLVRPCVLLYYKGQGVIACSHGSRSSGYSSETQKVADMDNLGIRIDWTFKHILYGEINTQTFHNLPFCSQNSRVVVHEACMHYQHGVIRTEENLDV